MYNQATVKQTLKSNETRENQEKRMVLDQGQVQDLHVQDVQEQLQDLFQGGFDWF